MAALRRISFDHRAAVRDAIFSAKGRRANGDGQAKVNELFRLVRGRIVRRAELATIAQQDDLMKRAQGNGGTRSTLREEGILVPGSQDRVPLVARSLRLPGPRKGELVSARVVPAPETQRGPSAEIDGRYWVVALDSDPVVSAPTVSRGTRSAD